MLIELILLVVMVLMYVQVADLRKQIADSREEEEYESFSDALESATEEEIALDELRTKREDAFELRISRIKEELDKGIPEKPSGSVADVYHPDVVNLPHDSIIDYETNPPDIEYSN